MKNVLITGCGRSGTGFVSRVLTLAGVPCGHELVFNPATALPAGATADRLYRLARVRADSSLAGVAFLPIPGLAVLHQTREPVAVIQSTMSVGFLHSPPSGKLTPFQRFIRRAQPLAFRHRRVVDRCIEHWIDWNERASRYASVTYRLEDLGPDLLRSMLAEHAGIDVKPGRMEAAFAAVETTFNTKDLGKRPPRQLIFGSALASDLRASARRFGYDLDDGRTV